MLALRKTPEKEPEGSRRAAGSLPQHFDPVLCSVLIACHFLKSFFISYFEIRILPSTLLTRPIDSLARRRLVRCFHSSWSSLFLSQLWLGVYAPGPARASRGRHGRHSSCCRCIADHRSSMALVGLYRLLSATTRSERA